MQTKHGGSEVEEDNKNTIAIYNDKAITSKILKETIKRYKKKDDFEINFCENPIAIRQLVEISPCMMIFVGISNKKSVVDVMTVYTWLKNFIKLNFVKILVCGNQTPKVENFFQKNGISDFIGNNISQKSLEYKVNFMFRTINSNHKKYLASPGNSNRKLIQLLNTGDVNNVNKHHIRDGRPGNSSGKNWNIIDNVLRGDINKKARNNDDLLSSIELNEVARFGNMDSGIRKRFDDSIKNEVITKHKHAAIPGTESNENGKSKIKNKDMVNRKKMIIDLKKIDHLNNNWISKTGKNTAQIKGQKEKELNDPQTDTNNINHNKVTGNGNKEDQHPAHWSGSNRPVEMKKNETDKKKADNCLRSGIIKPNPDSKIVNKQVNNGTWEGGGESADEIDKYWRDKEHQIESREKEHHDRDKINNQETTAIDKNIHFEELKKKESILKNSDGNWISEDEFLKQLDDDVEMAKKRGKEKILQMPPVNIDNEVQNLDLNLIIKKLDATNPNTEAKLISSKNARLVDAFDDYIIIMDSGDYEITSDEFEFTIKLNYLSDHFSFVIIGHLEEILSEVDGDMRLIFKIPHKYVEELQHIRGAYKKRQNSINNFLKMARGF
ncbi:MAG: hypothetical protein KAQ98_13520 [Bacteriovoracaceae bacterium]|nr:hypothetical protein [Bacteriovoracaceae bacterium]